MSAVTQADVLASLARLKASIEEQAALAKFGARALEILTEKLPAVTQRPRDSMRLDSIKVAAREHGLLEEKP